VHVVELLNPLLAAPDVEVVEATLPELRQTAVGPVERQRALLRRRPPARRTPQPPRHPLFQNPQDDGGSPTQRLGDEQVDVFGHDHVADKLEPVLRFDLTENLNKRVASAHRPEERKTPVATERDEVEVALSVSALEGVARWSTETTEAAMRAFAEAGSLKLGAVAQPLRVALTGRTTSPGIFEVLAVLGRQECLARLADQASGQPA